MKYKRSFSLWLCVLMLLPTLLFTASCGSDSPPKTETPSLTLNHTQLTLFVGDSFQLISTVKGVKNPSLLYSSSLDSVATVSSAGTVLAVAEGSTVITCTEQNEGVSAFCTVVVKSKNPGSQDKPTLVLDTTAITLSLGESRKIIATLHNTPEDDLIFTSTAPVIATVDQEGVITAVAAGSASIIVKTADGKLQATCLVTVNGNGARHVELDFTNLTLMAGETKQLKAKYITAISGDKTTLHYASSLPSVADVDQNGLITAKAAGTAVITVSNFDGTANATCTVKVTPKPVSPLTLDVSKFTLQVDDSYTLKATYNPTSPTESKVLTYTSSIPSIATVDANGTVTAKSVGSAVITVSNADGTSKATCTVTVIAKKVATLTLDVTTLTLDEGASRTLRPSYTPAKETDSRELYYSTSNSTVVTVDGNGKITAHAAGSANIIVKNKEGTASASCRITVVANSGKEASLSLDIYSLVMVIGENKTLHTSYTPAKETDSHKLIFTSSQPSVATVDENGKIVAKSAGKTVITVTNETESVKQECTVTVKPAPVTPDNTVKSGSFKTDTGTNLNLLVEWNLTKDEFHSNYRLNVNVYLESYSIICGKRTGSSFLVIDGTQFAFNTDALNYPGVTEKQKIFFTNASVVYAEDELPDSVVIEALWTFNGSYSGVSIPVLHPQAEVALK